MGTEFYVICHPCKEYADLHKLAPFLIQWSIDNGKFEVFRERLFDFITDHCDHGIAFTNEHSTLYANVEKFYTEILKVVDQ